MKKALDMLALAADLALGVILVVSGVAVMIGGATGMLWY